MNSDLETLLKRYLEKVIQDNRSIDARGVQQVNRMVELSMDDVYISLTVRIDHQDKLLQEIKLDDTWPIEESKRQKVENSIRHKFKKRLNALPQNQLKSVYEELGIAADDLWVRHNAWVLLGDPGSGKTTLLKHIALLNARDYQKKQNGHIPVFVSLRLLAGALEEHPEWEASRALFDYLEHFGLSEIGFDQPQERKALVQHFVQAINSGRILLLLDGLDEQRHSELQRKTVHVIEALQRRFHNPNNRFLVSSRIIGYDAAPLGPAFQKATLEPFNDEQMAAFFEKWCFAIESSEDVEVDEYTRKRAVETSQALIEQIHKNPGIRSLASNPLLCTIIGLIRRQGATLPEIRAELYKLCIDTFIFNWEINKRRRKDQVDSLNRDQTQAVLEEIALHFHEHCPENRASRSQLIQLTQDFLSKKQGMSEQEAAHKASQLLDLIRDVSGLLIDRGNDEYGFFHLTFQEYLTARAITRKKREIESYLKKYVFQPNWREVIRLAAAHQGMKDEESGSEFIQAICKQEHPHENLMHYAFRFAFLCMRETKVEPEVSDHMFQRWIEIYLNQPELQILMIQLLEQPGAKVHYYPSSLFILLEALKDEDSEVRQLATIALGNIKDFASTPHLIQALKDEEANVRTYAARALGKIKDPASTQHLIQILKEETIEFRTSAVEALGNIKDLASVEHLIQALKDEDKEMSWAAARALGNIKAPASTPYLIQVLKDKDLDLEMRWSIEAALVKIKDPGSVEHLIQALKNENSNVRQSAAEILGDIKEPSSIPHLIQALNDEDSNMRWTAAIALGNIGDPASIEHLIQALNDENSNVRSSAARALGNIGDPASIEHIIQALKDEEANVRWTAATALGDIKEPSSIPHLIQALKDEEANVRTYAARALGNIGDPVTIEHLIQALKDEEANVRQFTAEALGNIGDPASIEHIIQALKDEDPDVRSSSARALGNIGDPASTPHLIQALKDEGPDVRTYAAIVLGNIGDPASIEHLIQALNDEESSVRTYAAIALGNIGDPASTEHLIQALNDEDPYIRRIVAETLEKIDLGSSLCPN